MTEKPDDRPKSEPENIEDVDPKIFIVVDGKKLARPGLETYFAQASPGQAAKEIVGGCTCNPVMQVYCSCNKVVVCGCKGHTSSKSRSSGSGGRGCRCAPVH